MIVFAITTSTDHGGIALFEKASAKSPGKYPGKFLGEKLWTRGATENGPQSQSDVCTYELAQLLKSKKLKVTDISEILLDVGPGSFTGCRISASMAKTLAQSLKIPIQTITSLEVIYEQSKKEKSAQKNQPLAILDAHKSLFYVWNEEAGKIDLLNEEALKTRLAPLEIAFSNKLLEKFPLPQTMGQMFFSEPSQYKTLIWTEVEPLYIRVPDAVEKLRKN